MSMFHDNPRRDVAEDLNYYGPVKKFHVQTNLTGDVIEGTLRDAEQFVRGFTGVGYEWAEIREYRPGGRGKLIKRVDL